MQLWQKILSYVARLLQVNCSLILMNKNTVFNKIHWQLCSGNHVTERLLQRKWQWCLYNMTGAFPPTLVVAGTVVYLKGKFSWTLIRLRTTREFINFERSWLVHMKLAGNDVVWWRQMLYWVPSSVGSLADHIITSNDTSTVSFSDFSDNHNNYF